MDEQKKKASVRKRRRTRGIVLILVLLLLIIAAILGYRYWSKQQSEPYDSYEITYEATLSANAATNYIPYSDGYLRISRDGAEAINSYGSQIWNVSYNMNDPIGAVCGDYAAVADCENRIVYMMDGTGSLYWENVPYPIYEVEVSGVGVTAVRMNDGTNDYIQLINLAGEVLVEIKTVEKKDGFPIDIALSEDGTKLVTSYLVIEADEATSWLTFYNFGDVGQNYTNNLTGVYKYEEIVSKCVFLNNKTLGAFFETGAAIYSVPEKPELVSKIECEDTILHAAYNEDFVALMTDNTKAGTAIRTCVYNMKAEKVFDYSGVEKFEAVALSGEDVVFYNNGACLIVRMDGTLRLNTSFGDKKVLKLLPVNGRDKFLLFEETKVSTIQLIRTKE